MTDKKLSHIDNSGRPAMVDVSLKKDTLRIAIAEGRVLVLPETIIIIKKNEIKKGDVLSIAKIAGIQGAKQASTLIPLCHPLQLTHINVDLWIDEKKSAINIQSTVNSYGKTGVEMEALTAVAVSALTVYDMIKAVDHQATIEGICLVQKQGGKSGAYFRDSRK